MQNTLAQANIKIFSPNYKNNVFSTANSKQQMDINNCKLWRTITAFYKVFIKNDIQKS